MKRIRRARLDEEKRSQYSLLTHLVLFVFFIQVISLVFLGVIYSSLVFLDIFPRNIHQPVFPGLIGMFLSSLVLVTVISSLAGKYFLQPIKKLIWGTQEIANGNFNIRIENTGGGYDLEQLRRSFNAMAKELASIESLRSDFINNISHEFKTPISSIKGFAKLLRKEGVSQQDREEYLNIIISESDRLAKLSGNILLLSNLEQKSQVDEKVSFYLDEQLRRTVLLLEPQLKKKNLTISLTLDAISLYQDEELLSHVWINLLNNAIKFTPDNQSISIYSAITSTEVAISIADTGIGMDESTIKNIFDKFYQAEQSRSTDGNGLGLSLVKKIVELCDGSIQIQSKLGQGTTFTVLLPFSKA